VRVPRRGMCVVGPVSGGPVAKITAGPTLLALVAVSSHLNHGPLHRQEGVFRRHGLELARSSLCRWLGDGGSEPEVAALWVRLPGVWKRVVRRTLEDG
jgi:transposase